MESPRLSLSFSPFSVLFPKSTSACTQRAEALYGRMMLVGVLLYYAVTVVPEQYSRFCNIFGDSEDTISRLNSLRKYVYDQDEDGLISAKIGYRLDMSMNTTYHCLLYLLTLFMLYTYNDPVEIILNSLAVSRMERRTVPTTASAFAMK